MAKVLFQFPCVVDPLLTKAEVEQMSLIDLTQSMVFVIAVAKDRPLTDHEISNFWLIHDERTKRFLATREEGR